jgi:hypothetical protein
MTKQQQTPAKPFEIMGAIVKDGYCTYDVNVMQGKLIGEKSKIDGPLIIHEDLRYAMNKLRVHLAVMDDAFKKAHIDIENIDNERAHDLVQDYDVSGFKIKKADENIQVSIIGSKYLSCVTGRMTCVTPFVLLDAGTEYKWYNELLADVENVRSEVEQYKAGKGSMPEPKVKKEKKNKKQKSILDADAVTDVEFEEK